MERIEKQHRSLRHLRARTFRPRKTWWYGVGEDMKKVGLSLENA